MNYTWNEAQNTFDHPIKCPYPDCSILIDDINVPKTKMITKCNQCKQLVEWTLHPSSSVQVRLYWPRKADEHYSTFDGHKYQHVSCLDWPEVGGSSMRSGFVNDPFQSVFGKPNTKVDFSLKEAWAVTFGEEDAELKSIGISQGTLIACNDDGNMYVFSDIYSQEKPTLDQSLKSGFKVSYTANDPKYQPSCRYPYICLCVDSEVVIWSLKTPNSPVESKMFTLPEEVMSSGYQLMGSPTSFVHEGKTGFVLALGNLSNEFDPTYLCSFIEEEHTGEFIFKTTEIKGLVQPPLILEGNVNALIGFAFGGFQMISIPIREFWNETPSVTEEMINKPPVVKIQASIHHTITAAVTLKNNFEIIVVHRHPAKVTTYISIFDHTKLEWESIPLSGDYGNEFFAIAAGSTSPYFKGDTNISGSISISSNSGVHHFSHSGQPSGSPYINEGGVGDFAGSKEPSIICNAGIINRVGGSLHLTWDASQWGSNIKRSVRFNKIKRHTYNSGLAFSGNRIFLSDTHNGRAILFAVDVIAKF
jgi:hypothetical protein